MKILIGIAVLVLVVGGGYYLMSSNQAVVPQRSVDTIPAPAKDEKKAETTPDAKEVMVSLKNFAFSPSTVTIKAGTKVVWTNEDAAGHTVTGDTGAFVSKILSPGKSFEQVFAGKGTFSYHCELHPSMKGTVVVE